MVKHNIKVYLLFSLSHLLVHVYSILHIALIPVFMEEFHLSIQEVSLVVSIPYVCQFATSVPSGLLADRIGHRRQIVAGLLVLLCALFLMSRASDFLLLTASASLIMIASQIFHPPMLSNLSELFSTGYQSRAIGIQNAVGLVGAAIGPLSFGMLVQQDNWRVIYLSGIIPVAISLALIILIKTFSNLKGASTQAVDEKRETLHQKEVETLRKGFPALLLTVFLIEIGVVSISTFFTSYLTMGRGTSMAYASLIFGIGSLAGIFGHLGGGMLGDSLGGKPWVILALLGGTASVLGILFTPLWLLVPLYLLYVFFYNSILPVVSSLVAQFSPRSARGLAYGMYFLPFNLVGAIIPSIVGAVIANTGYWCIFLIATTMFTVSVVFTRLLKA